MSLVSSRDVQLLRLVQQGLLNRQIAGRLEMTPGAVSHALTRLYRRLGVQCRTAAVLKAANLGLIEPTCPGCRERVARIGQLEARARLHDAALELLETESLDDMRDENRRAGANA